MIYGIVWERVERERIRRAVDIITKLTGTAFFDSREEELFSRLTNKTAGTRDLHNYLWGAAFSVMVAWLLIVLFGKTLIRRMR